jgi:hypothetical protein
MIQHNKTKQLIQVPCKNKFNGSIKTFEVMAYDFSDAIKELEWVLDLRWIIGYGAM